MANILEAAKQSNRRETLEALRNKIADAIDNCESGRDIAALSKRLMEVMGELDSLPDPNKGKNSAQLARDRVRNRNASQG